MTITCIKLVSVMSHDDPAVLLRSSHFPPWSKSSRLGIMLIFKINWFEFIDLLLEYWFVMVERDARGCAWPNPRLCLSPPNNLALSDRSSVTLSGGELTLRWIEMYLTIKRVPHCFRHKSKDKSKYYCIWKYFLLFLKLKLIV